MKRYLLQQCWPLNQTSSKCIWIGAKLGQDAIEPKMLLYGNLGGIELSIDQWTRLCEQKDLILNFMDCKVKKLKIDLSTADNSLIISGRIAKTPLLYMYQVDLISKDTTYICIADPTVDHLFKMSDLFTYYFNTLLRNINEIDFFCKSFKHDPKQSLDIPDYVDGIDYKLLRLELTYFPQGSVMVEKKPKKNVKPDCDIVAN
jgi:hypothetical protein